MSTRPLNTAYDGGQDGRLQPRALQLREASATTVPRKIERAYGYVPQNEVEPYFAMAEQYAFADDMFQTQAGPSFPAHQYILSGTSTIATGSALRASENPLTPGAALHRRLRLAAGFARLADRRQRNGGSADLSVLRSPDAHRSWRPARLDLALLSVASRARAFGTGPMRSSTFATARSFHTDVVAPPSRSPHRHRNGTLPTSFG